MCSPEEAVDGKCPITKQQCCYFCRYIVECYKKWKNGDHYCKIEKRNLWCNSVKRYIDTHGFQRDIWSVS